MRVKLTARFSVEVDLDERGGNYDKQVRHLLDAVSDHIHGLELPGGDSEATFSTIDAAIVTSPRRACRRCSSPVGADEFCTHPTCGFHYYPQGDARGWEGCPRCDREDHDLAEFAMQQGMAFGAGAYNEAMGYDTSSPDPCGHHCPSDCPRCGQEEN